MWGLGIKFQDITIFQEIIFQGGSKLETNRLTKEEIFKWCSIPKERIQNQEGLKVKMEVRRDKAAVMTELGHMMADEVIEHNRLGLPTTSVLPEGPTEENDIYKERDNSDRISL